MSVIRSAAELWNSLWTDIEVNMMQSLQETTHFCCIAGKILRVSSLQLCRGQYIEFARGLLILHLAAQTFLDLMTWKRLASKYAKQLAMLTTSYSKTSWHSLRGDWFSTFTSLYISRTNMTLRAVYFFNNSSNLVIMTLVSCLHSEAYVLVSGPCQ